MNWALYNWVDWAIICVLAVSTLLSLWRGFSREALSLAGWVAAFVIANFFADRLANELATMIENVAGRYIVAYVLLFVGVLLVAGVSIRLFAKVVRVTGLQTFDRLLGTVFGFARGIIIVLFAAFLVRSLLPPEGQLPLDQSQLMPHMDVMGKWMHSAAGQLNAGQLPQITI